MLRKPRTRVDPLGERVDLAWREDGKRENIFCCFIKIKDLVKKCFVKCNHSDLLLYVVNHAMYL